MARPRGRRRVAMIMRALAMGTLSLILASQPGLADPRTYIGAVTANVPGNSPTSVLVCNGDLLAEGIGGVCFPAGHIPPTANGRALIWIEDVSQTVASDQVSGFACHPHPYEAGVCVGWAFCRIKVLSVGEGWHPDEPLYVLIDGPVYGSAVQPACPWDPLSHSIFSAPNPGLAGSVHHSL